MYILILLNCKLNIKLNKPVGKKKTLTGIKILKLLCGYYTMNLEIKSGNNVQKSTHMRQLNILEHGFFQNCKIKLKKLCTLQRFLESPCKYLSKYQCYFLQKQKSIF